MRRTRRISIEIEHREITISIPRGGGQHWAEAAMPSAPATDIAEEPTEACPLCGSSSWVLLLDAATAQQRLGAGTIGEMLLQCDLHLQSSRSGMLWSCRQSFQSGRQIL